MERIKRMKPATNMVLEINKANLRTFGRKAVRLSKSQEKLLVSVLPELEIPFSEGKINLSDYFTETGPLHLEIGFGDGEYTAALSERFPQHRIIGCEVFKNGIAALLKLIESKSLRNIKILQKDAIIAINQMFHKGVFDYIHLNHPDPWQKKRHHKRRIIQSDTVKLFEKSLKPGGELLISTDIYEYYCWILECMDEAKSLKQVPTNGRFLDSFNEDRIVTRFERKGNENGRVTRHLRYKKCNYSAHP